jgi:flagellar biosynthesis regulator FlbT
VRRCAVCGGFGSWNPLAGDSISTLCGTISKCDNGAWSPIGVRYRLFGATLSEHARRHGAPWRLAKDTEQRVTVVRIGRNTARRVADVLRCILALPLVQASSTSSPATRCAHCTVHSLASDPRRYDAARRSVDRLMDCLSQCKRAALKCKQCSELVRDGRVDEALVTGRCAIPRPSARVRTHAATVSRAHTLGLRACISVLVVARAHASLCSSLRVRADEPQSRSSPMHTRTHRDSHTSTHSRARSLVGAASRVASMARCNSGTCVSIFKTRSTRRNRETPRWFPHLRPGSVRQPRFARGCQWSTDIGLRAPCSDGVGMRAWLFVATCRTIATLCL